jgi:hypothetical protein
VRFDYYASCQCCDFRMRDSYVIRAPKMPEMSA